MRVNLIEDLEENQTDLLPIVTLHKSQHIADRLWPMLYHGGGYGRRGTVANVSILVLQILWKYVHEAFGDI